MITLSNGKKLLFLMASGMMGFDGKGPTSAHRLMYKILKFFGLHDPSLFATITKTVSLQPIEGPKKIRPLANGWWNNYGLDNPGISRFLLMNKENDFKNIIISITAKNLPELQMIIGKINVLARDIIAIELNVSCSNIEKLETDLIIDMCKFLAGSSKIPVILKIGQKNDYLKIAKKTENIIQAFDINSVPSVDKWGPGAISGEPAQFINQKIVRDLKNNTKTPVIGPSIWRYQNLEELFFEFHVDAVSFGSVSMIHPKRPWGPILPTLYAKKYISGN